MMRTHTQHSDSIDLEVQGVEVECVVEYELTWERYRDAIMDLR